MGDKGGEWETKAGNGGGASRETGLKKAGGVDGAEEGRNR